MDSCGAVNSISNLSSHFSHDLSFKEKLKSSEINFEADFLPVSFNMSCLYNQINSDKLSPHSLHNELKSSHSVNSHISLDSLQLSDQLVSNLPYPTTLHFQFPCEFVSNAALVYFSPHSSVENLSRGLACQISKEASDPNFKNSAFLDCLKSYENGQDLAPLSDLSSSCILNGLENNDDLKKDTFPPVSKDTFWDQLQSQWDSLAKHDVDSHTWLIHREDNEKEIAYQFSSPKLNEDICNLMEQGILLLGQGQLSTAVSFFEAELQHRDENVKAWLLLGTCHAENEQDDLAISALRRCIQLESSNLDARLLLAVSYANESKHRQTCKILREWLLLHPSFSSLFKEEPADSPDPAFIPSFLDSKLHSNVVSLFQQALSTLNSHSSDKSDLLMALGVLYHISEDYTLSIDCFNSALSLQQDNPLLWNKLGATYANSDHYEEAIHAYKEALKLYPNYVRCRYNLGISCMNLKSFKEACQHFIIALKLQGQGRGPNSTAWNLWSTLRLALMLGDMPEFFSHVDNRNLELLLAEFLC